MAELKLKIIPDLRKLSQDISKLVKQKFNINVSGQAGGGGGGPAAGAGKEQKKQTKGLFKIAGLVGFIVASLKALKPVIDFVSIVIALIFFGILKLVKFFLGGGMGELFTKLREKVVGWLKTIWEGLKTFIGESWMRIVEWLKNIWTSLKDKLLEVWTNIVNWLKILWEGLKGVLKGVWTSIVGALQRGWQILKEAFFFVRDKIIEWLKIGWNVLKEGFTALGEWFSKIWDTLKARFTALMQRVKELKDKIVQKLVDLKNKIVTALKEVVAKVKELPGRIGSAIRAAISTLSRLFGPKSSGSPPGGTSVEDAIITPQGKVIKTDPKDFLIATKNPGAMGGGGGTTFNFNGIGMDEAMERVKRELSIDINRSNKF